MNDITKDRPPLPERTLGLEDTTVLITGGASGIGLATSRYLLGAGARVVIVDVNQEVLEKAGAELGEPERVVTVKSDTTAEDQMTAAVDTAVKRFGRLDGLVTCAGIRQTSQSALEIPREVWSRIIEVNLWGTFVALRAGGRVMVAQRSGAIVTVASMAALIPRMGQAAYGASKAGVMHLTRTFALEFSRHQVRVNAVNPGTTLTPLIEKAMRDEGADLLEKRIKGDPSQFRGGVPLGRMSYPEDQAGVIAFLLSPLARFMTGQMIFVDGGESMI
ncbi:MAG: SDR family oxidoreductase [Actinomycetota bacterium]